MGYGGDFGSSRTEQKLCREEGVDRRMIASVSAGAGTAVHRLTWIAGIDRIHGYIFFSGEGVYEIRGYRILNSATEEGGRNLGCCRPCVVERGGCGRLNKGEGREGR